MTGAGVATVDALRASLLALVSAPDDAPEWPALRENARRQWEAHSAAFGLVLLDDHDPQLAPGLHEARVPGPLVATRVRQLTRSWEMFDRTFEACSWDLECALFDERLAPCFGALGVPVGEVELARDHAFVIDERYVAMFPAERWAEHAARHDAAGAEDGDPMVRALSLVSGSG